MQDIAQPPQATAQMQKLAHSYGDATQRVEQKVDLNTNISSF